MAGKNKAVFAIYSTRPGAEHGAEMLLSSGFSTSDISVLFPENLGSKEIGTEKSTKAPEGAITGAGSGAVVGGTLGLLAGIGALAIPGIGPLIAAGPIVAALAGIGVGGAVGGFAGALIGMGIPEFEAQAVRRPSAKRRDSPFRALQHIGRDQTCKGRARRYAS